MTGSPLLDQVHHPSGSLNLKRFSSVNITFLKSTCFVNHLLAHSSLAPLCFFVSVIFFLAFAYFKPILCSVLCTVWTFTSNSHFSFTFLAVTFSPDVKSRCHSLLHSPFSPLANWSFLTLSSACIRPLISTASNPWRSFWCWGHLPASSVPNKRLLLNAFNSLNLIVLLRNVWTIYAVRLSYVNIVVGAPVPQNSVQAENLHTATYTWT